MRGVVFHGERSIEIRQYPDPSPGPHEVVVQMKASGMCGSDLTPYRASRSEPALIKSCIRGHEPCGVVFARGSAVGEAEAAIGQRVMIHHYSGCGVCKYCRSGYSQMCIKGYVTYGGGVDGGHADFIRVLPGMLLPLPDELTFEEGAAISCGSGTAYQGLRRLEISGLDTLAVFGQGPVGLSATMLGKAMGARVIAADISSQRLSLARDLGADHAVNPNEHDPIEAIRELTCGEGAAAAIDCTGSSPARLAAVRSVRKWGRVCLVGIGGPTEFEITKDFIHKQLTLHGSWTLGVLEQIACARFVVDRKIPLHRIYTHRFKLDDAVEAYRLFDTQTTGKGVLIP
jgi:(R,R)-butanediol dehydrogenase/meso-butanediol dehydrogenase/diacetyl reductase